MSDGDSAPNRSGPDLPDGRSMSFAERFQHAYKRALKLFPVDEFKMRFGVGDRTMRAVKDDNVGLDVVWRLAKETSIPAGWIIFGDAPGDAPEAGYGAPPALPDFALVPRLDVRASAGAGALAPYNDLPIDVIAFRRDWLRKLGINPRYARAMLATGDSMWPTIDDGDLLLVDESITSVIDHGIYVVIYQGMVLVKRLQKKPDGTLLLKSDNDRYDTELVKAEDVDQIAIAGRVRWYGRTI